LKKRGLAEKEFLEKGGDLCRGEQEIAIAWLNTEFFAAPGSQSNHCRGMRG
jgi:hypothetical protein